MSRKKRRQKKKTLRRAATALKEKKKRQPSELSRAGEIVRGSIDEKARSVEVAFSSETDKVRFFGIPQILLHEKGAVDLEPLRSAGAVLYLHDPNMAIGRADNVRLDEKDRVARATAILDDDDEAERIFRKIQSGTIRGTSVRAKVHQWQILNEGETWRSPGGKTFRGPADIAASWSVREFSFTPIPEDTDVGVGRSVDDGDDPHREETETMDPKLKAALVKRGMSPEATDEEAQAFLLKSMAEDETERSVKDGDPPKDPDPPDETQRSADPSGMTESKVKELLREERERQTEIRNLCSMHEVTRSLADELCASDVSLDVARTRILEKLKGAMPSMQSPTRIEVGTEARDKFRSATEDFLLFRTGALERHEKDPARLEKRLAAAREYDAANLLDVARGCLRQANLPYRGSPDEIITRALTHSESDFPNITENVANKNLLAGWMETPSTWEAVGIAASVPDFKDKAIYKLGDSGDLEETDDLTPMPEGTVPEVKEKYAILTYAKRFGIGRKALINDDMGAFDRIPRLMGAAARRKANQLFWDLLTSVSGVGPTMAEDSEALFSASHTSGSNYDASAGAPTVANLNAAMAAFRKQKNLVASGETGREINITPETMVVPAALEGTARELLNSAVNPASSNDTGNIYQRAFRLVVEPILDGKTNGATAWYLVAGLGSLPGAEVAFLNGRREPNTIRIEGTNALGLEWGVYLDCGVKFFEHRAWYRKRGA